VGVIVLAAPDPRTCYLHANRGITLLIKDLSQLFQLFGLQFLYNKNIHFQPYFWYAKKVYELVIYNFLNTINYPMNPYLRQLVD
jgi:hypothetical protein